MKIILAEPRGFCAGVDRAIAIVERAINVYGTPVYIRHEIVHNKYVVEDLKKKGAVFVNEIDEIPEGGVAIFSAHGVSEEVENNAKSRNLLVIDATCPLVKKVHKEAVRFDDEGFQLILIGHYGHPEIIGTSGRVQNGVTIVSTVEDVHKLNMSNKIAYITQTTLSINDTKDILDALLEKFPNIKGTGLHDICYATQNRQEAVKKLANMVDLLLVVGSKNSSNSNRLRDFGEKMNTPSYLIDSSKDIQKKWLKNVSTIGITAGASAPEILVKEVIDYLDKKYSISSLKIMEGTKEKVKFNLPEFPIISN